MGVKGDGRALHETRSDRTPRVCCAVVGRFGTAAQLAALAPGTLVCDSSAYVLTFLGIAATNLYATAIAEGRPDNASRVLSNSLALAVLSGIPLSSCSLPCVCVCVCVCVSV